MTSKLVASFSCKYIAATKDTFIFKASMYPPRSRENYQFQWLKATAFMRQMPSAICLLLVLPVAINANAESQSAPHKAGKPLRASAAFEQLRDIAPDQTSPSNSVTRQLAESGDYETAVKQYQQLLSSGGLQAEVLARLLALHLTDSDGARLPTDAEIVSEINGTIHYKLANRLILHGFRLAALNEYCLSVSSAKPEAGGYREIGTLMSETGHYLVATNALNRYLLLAPDSLDAITIWAKSQYIEMRHANEIDEQLADAEAAQPKDLDLALRAVGSTE